MATETRDKINSLSRARRRKISARAGQLLAEEMSLRELRKAYGLAQERVAELLGIGQDSVSRIEKRTDLLLSTVRKYVEGMSGRLSLVVEFADHTPVILSGLSTLEAEPSAPQSKRGGKRPGAGRPRIYSSNAERQRAHRERMRARKAQAKNESTTF